MDRLPELLGEEGDRDQSEADPGGEGEQAHKGPQPARREEGKERRGRQHGDPDPLRCLGLLPGEDQAEEGERPPARPPQVADCEGNEEDEEEVEERPAADPGAGRLVDAGGGEEAPAGGEVELAGDRLEVVVPADRRQGEAAGEAPLGSEEHLPLAHLDAGARRVVALGDHLVAAGDHHALEPAGGRHLQAPAAGEGAGEQVLPGVAVAVEVEPESVAQGELVGRRVGVAASPLGDPQGLAGPQPVSGELLPVVGERRLLRIDRRHAEDVGEAETRPRVEDPDLLVRPRPAGRRQGERRDRPGVAGGELERPRPWPRLDAQPAVRLQAGGERPVERQGEEAGG